MFPALKLLFLSLSEPPAVIRAFFDSSFSEIYLCAVPKFAGSNPAEAVGFLGRKKSSARLPSEGK